MRELDAMGLRAREAAALLARSDKKTIDNALEEIARGIVESKQDILAANAADVAGFKARGGRPALLDRLTLTGDRLEAVARQVLEVRALTSPVGAVQGGMVHPNGMRIVKTRVPLGVVGMIYEARPNVTVDAAALCLKAGNACILRGGKEAAASNLALCRVMQAALVRTGLESSSVQLVADTTRESAEYMMGMEETIDVLIPRGSAQLIRTVVRNATVPVIQTGAGNCHIYIDSAADLIMGLNIAVNAKASRPTVCNAAETLLVHRDAAGELLPLLKEAMDEKKVSLRGCEETVKILGGTVAPVTEEDYETEFLDYILAVRVVDSIDQAIGHIRRYSTRHSEAIVTESYSAAEYFTARVDAAAVYVNASTRFTDGSEFGQGAEIGISTQKLHARGPLGLAQLTCDKYVVYGTGQVRE